MEQDFLSLFLESLVTNLPRLFGAILVILMGLLVSRWMGKRASRFLEKIHIHQALKRLGWQEALKKLDIKFNTVILFGELVKWFFLLFFLMAASEIIGLPQLGQFLSNIIGYFPNIFIAVLIFVFAVFLADFSQKIMVASLEREKITYSKLLGRLIRWIIWSLATLAILYQLQIVPVLILTIFVGLVFLIVLAVGIAFGLGGKDIAGRILKELEDKFR